MAEPTISEKELEGGGALSSEQRARLISQRMARGLFGWLFGTGYEKSGNIAGFVIIVAFALMVAVFIWLPDSATFTRKDAATLLLSVITLALGYLFGRGSRGAE